MCRIMLYNEEMERNPIWVNDRPFIFGYAGVFESANRHLEEAANSKWLLEWIRHDIAELIKAEQDIATHTYNSRIMPGLCDVVELPIVKSVKAPKQTVKYQQAKIIDTAELPSLGGSIKLLLQCSKKINITQLQVLLYTFTAVSSLINKKIKTQKEQFVCNRLEYVFNCCKKFTKIKGDSTADPVWSWNMQHFIARSLVDPELIRKLIANTDNKIKNLSTGLGVLADAMASVVCTDSNKKEVHNYIINTIMKIIEVKDN